MPGWRDRLVLGTAQLGLKYGVVNSTGLLPDSEAISLVRTAIAGGVLTVPGRIMTVHSMTEMMTRFLGLGFTLPQVVTMCTANPAKAAGVVERLGSLAVGRQADISVLDVRPGDWMVYDVLGAGLRVDRAVVPFVTVKKGRVFTPDWGPRSWGWEPDRALPAGGPIRGGCC